MPSYKLTYFDFSGLAEPARMLFAYGKIPFTDERLAKEDWSAWKPKMPFGVVPVLEVDGTVIHQSVAIGRYVANLVNLVGKDALENAQIDATVDTISDFRIKLVECCLFEKDETRKAALKKTLDTEILPFVLSRLDAQVKNGHIVLGKLTWADIVFTAIYDIMKLIAGGDIFAQYPNLQQVYKQVLEIPQIKTYVENRPKDKL